MNELVWAPNFTLPTIYTLVRAIQLGTIMGDIDTREIFLNFMMHKSPRKKFGVDVRHIWSEDTTLE